MADEGERKKDKSILLKHIEWKTNYNILSFKKNKKKQEDALTFKAD